jgi:hypothetical protein
MSNKVQIPKPKFQMFDILILTFDILIEPLNPWTLGPYLL